MRLQRLLRCLSRRLGYLIGCSFVLAGCASAPKQTALMREAEAVDITSTELRLRLHEFALRFGGQMEQTALDVQAENSDAGIEASLNRWLLYGLPAYYKTLFQSDPYLSLWDSWVFTAQLIHYYEAGPGKDDFGEFQDRVIAIHKTIYDEFAQLERRAWRQADLSEDEKLIQDWVSTHPLKSYFFVRQSVLVYESLAEIIARGSGGLSGALQSVEAGMADMNARIIVYTEFIPKQIQWTVELTALELGSEAGDIDLDDLLGISVYLDRVDTLIADNLAFAAGSIDRQLVGTLTAISEERKAVLEGVAGERAAVLSSIASERRMALSDIERIAQTTLEQAGAGSGTAIGQLFRSALLIVLAIFVSAVSYRFISVKVIGTPRG